MIIQWSTVRIHGLLVAQARVVDDSGRILFKTQQNSEEYARTVAERWYNTFKAKGKV